MVIRALPFPNATNVGPVYFVDDEEIDFDRVLREEKITLPKGVSWTAHGLAVEGVQPLIPENPPAIPKPGPKDIDQEITKSPPQTNSIFPLTPPSESCSTVKKQQQQFVKQVLSQELRLYLYAAHVVIITEYCSLRQAGSSRVCAMMQDYRRSYHTSFAGSEEGL